MRDLLLALDGRHNGRAALKLMERTARGVADDVVRIIQHNASFLLLAQQLALGDGAGGGQRLAVRVTRRDLRDGGGGGGFSAQGTAEHADGYGLDAAGAIRPVDDLGAFGD